MAQDLNFLAEEMQRESQDTKADVAKRLRACATAVLTELVHSTPVDTGAARSNWLVSLGSGTDAVIAPHAPGEHLGIGESANAEAAISAGKAVISQFKGDGELHIQNNVAYIDLLNEGSSKQAPAAFVETAVQAGIAAVNDARIV